MNPEKVVIGVMPSGSPVIGLDNNDGLIRNAYVIAFSKAKDQKGEDVMSVNLYPCCTPLITEKKTQLEGIDTLQNLVPININKTALLTVFDDIYELARGAQYEQLYNDLTGRKGILRATERDLLDITRKAPNDDEAKLVNLPK